jgi:hypothetical protein
MNSDEKYLNLPSGKPTLFSALSDEAITGFRTPYSYLPRRRRLQFPGADESGSRVFAAGDYEALPAEQGRGRGNR